MIQVVTRDKGERIVGEISEKGKEVEEIYKTFYQDIYRVCMHFVNDEYLAQDIMQQTFVRFYKHVEEINPTCVYAYLLRTVKNLICNYYRAYSREYLVDEIFEEAHPNEMITVSLEEEYFRGKRSELEIELGKQIFDEMKVKQASYYKIFTMRYVEDKSHDEIAEELGITKEVLYSRIYRGKNWVRKRYEEAFENLEEKLY